MKLGREILARELGMFLGCEQASSGVEVADFNSGADNPMALEPLPLSSQSYVFVGEFLKAQVHHASPTADETQIWSGFTRLEPIILMLILRLLECILIGGIYRCQ